MNDLIIENLEWASNLAKRKKRSLPHIPLEDLESAAHMGLTEAARKKFTAKKQFFKYAKKRINGEMSNYVRQCNMGWNRTRPVSVMSIDDMDFVDQHENKMEKVQKLYNAALGFLSSEGRMILRMYYEDKMTMRQIGDKLGLSESMVSLKIKGFHDSLSKKREEILAYANE
jgi:RNA polymerase sigma factor (sigma-70 family)